MAVRKCVVLAFLTYWKCSGWNTADRGMGLWLPDCLRCVTGILKSTRPSLVTLSYQKGTRADVFRRHRFRYCYPPEATTGGVQLLPWCVFPGKRSRGLQPWAETTCQFYQCAVLFSKWRQSTQDCSSHMSDTPELVLPAQKRG